MQSTSTPARSPLVASQMGSLSTSSASARLGESSSMSLPRTPQQRPDGAGQGKETTANGTLRSRKSNAPDIGTPIQMASSSPYRTPESTSKASLFLARTPFGTPAKSASTASQATPAPTTSTSQPLKPVTGFWPESLALAKSLFDSRAYATFALQPRPHLPYSGFLARALRVNWIRLGLIYLVSHHILFCVALFRPSSPLQVITLPVRPTAVLLSTATFGALLTLLLLLPGQTFSLTDKKWKVDQHVGLHDERIAGFTLSAGSPANTVACTLRLKAFWLSALLHALFALCLAAANALALIRYQLQSEQSTSWSPYETVSVRLSQGFKTSATRPNERFWFLLCCNCFVGGSYALLRAVSDARRTNGAAAPFAPPRFEAQASFETAFTRLTVKLRQGGLKAFLVGISTPVVVLQVYLLFRRPIFRFVLSLIGHQSPLRPLLIPSFKRSLLTAELVFRSSLLALTTIALLEILNVGWEVFGTQPVSTTAGGLSKYSREPTKCLIRGMQSRRTAVPDEAHLGAAERSYFAHFAFAEMALVVATDAERRKAIFRDVGNAGSTIAEGGGRSAWAAIADECIQVLRQERRWIEEKGKATVTGTAKSATQAGKSQLKPVDAAHQVSVAVGSNGVKRHAPSIWDRLSSTASARANPSAGSGGTAPASTPSVNTNGGGSEDLSTLLHRIAPATPSKDASQTATTAIATSSQIKPTIQPPSMTAVDLLASLVVSLGHSLLSLFRLLPSDLQHVIRNSFVVRKAISTQAWLFTSSHRYLLLSGAVPHDEALAIWSVQTLGALLSASLEQDEYGTVALASNIHLGTEDVLEECAALLLVLQRWGLELSSDTQTEDERSEMGKTNLQCFEANVAPLILALRTAITLVLGALEPTGFRLRQSSRKAVEDALAMPNAAVAQV